MATFPAKEKLLPFTCNNCGVNYVNHIRHTRKCNRQMMRQTIEDINARKEYIQLIFGRIQRLSEYAALNKYKHADYIESLYNLVNMAKRKAFLYVGSMDKLSKSEKQEMYRYYRIIAENFQPPSLFGYNNGPGYYKF